MGELRGYGEREQTRTGHLREVAGFAGWRSMVTVELKDLDEFARAMEHDCRSYCSGWPASSCCRRERSGPE